MKTALRVLSLAAFLALTLSVSFVPVFAHPPSANQNNCAGPGRACSGAAASFTSLRVDGGVTAGSITTANGNVISSAYKWYGTAQNSGTTNTTLAFVTLPAGAFASVGQTVRFTIGANMLSNANTKYLFLNLGSTDLFSNTLSFITTPTGTLHAQLECGRLDATTLYCTGTTNNGSNKVEPVTIPATGLNFATALTFNVVGRGGASNDVTLRSFIVEALP